MGDKKSRKDQAKGKRQKEAKADKVGKEKRDKRQAQPSPSKG